MLFEKNMHQWLGIWPPEVKIKLQQKFLSPYFIFYNFSFWNNYKFTGSCRQYMYLSAIFFPDASTRNLTLYNMWYVVLHCFITCVDLCNLHSNIFITTNVAHVLLLYNHATVSPPPPSLIPGDHSSLSISVTSSFQKCSRIWITLYTTFNSSLLFIAE